MKLSRKVSLLAVAALMIVAMVVSLATVVSAKPEKIVVYDPATEPTLINESKDFTAITNVKFIDKDGKEIVYPEIEEEEEATAPPAPIEHKVVAGVVFDVEIASGYQLHDDDLHDGYVPVDPVVVVKALQDNGSVTETVIAKANAGDYKGHYVVAKYDFDKMSVAVRGVEPKSKTIDSIVNEDMIIEPDGCTYTFQNAAIKGNVTFLNTQNDWTRVQDGALVAEDGKIVVIDDITLKSQIPSVVIKGTFTNDGTVTFTQNTGLDSANRVFTYSLGNGSKVYNNGTINIGESVYANIGATVNSANGVINVVSTVVDRLYVYNSKNQVWELNNGGEQATTLTILNGNANYVTAVNDGKLNIGHLGTVMVAMNFTNNGTIETCGVFMQYMGNFTNNKTGVVHLYDEAWIDTVNGTRHIGFVDNTYKGNGDYLPFRAVGSLQLIARTITTNSYNQHTNAGKIYYEGEYGSANGYYFVNFGMFTNTSSGTFSIKTTYTPGGGVEGGSWDTYYPQIANYGVLNNNGTFEVVGQKVKFYNYRYGNDPILINAINGSKFTAGTLTTPNYALEINNSGTMIVSDLINQGFITNTGDFTVNGLLSGEKYNGKWYYWEKNKARYKDACGDCPSHGADAIFVYAANTVTNKGTWNNVGESRFVFFTNEGTVENSGTIVVGQISNGKPVTDVIGGIFPVGYAEWAVITESHMWEFLNYGTVNNKGTIINYGLYDENATLENAGTFYNYEDAVVRKDAVVNNTGKFANGDDTYFNYEDKGESAELVVVGKFVNDGKFEAGIWGYVRIEGELDSTKGTILNRGEVSNVGTLTVAKANLDNQGALHGYELSYVKAADAETKAEETTAKADETTAQKKSDTPAAATSDVAVAGFAMIAALALAGVVVAKKVR